MAAASTSAAAAAALLTPTSPGTSAAPSDAGTMSLVYSFSSEASSTPNLGLSAANGGANNAAATRDERAESEISAQSNHSAHSNSSFRRRAKLDLVHRLNKRLGRSASGGSEHMPEYSSELNDDAFDEMEDFADPDAPMGGSEDEFLSGGDHVDNMVLKNQKANPSNLLHNYDTACTSTTTKPAQFTVGDMEAAKAAAAKSLHISNGSPNTPSPKKTRSRKTLTLTTSNSNASNPTAHSNTSSDNEVSPPRTPGTPSTIKTAPMTPSDVGCVAEDVADDINQETIRLQALSASYVNSSHGSNGSPASRNTTKSTNNDNDSDCNEKDNGINTKQPKLDPHDFIQNEYLPHLRAMANSVSEDQLPPAAIATTNHTGTLLGIAPHGSSQLDDSGCDELNVSAIALDTSHDHDRDDDPDLDVTPDDLNDSGVEKGDDLNQTFDLNSTLDSSFDSCIGEFTLDDSIDEEAEWTARSAANIAKKELSASADATEAETASPRKGDGSAGSGDGEWVSFDAPSDGGEFFTDFAGPNGAGGGAPAARVWPPVITPPATPGRGSPRSGGSRSNRQPSSSPSKLSRGSSAASKRREKAVAAAAAAAAAAKNYERTSPTRSTPSSLTASGSNSSRNQREADNTYSTPSRLATRKQASSSTTSSLTVTPDRDADVIASIAALNAKSAGSKSNESPQLNTPARIVKLSRMLQDFEQQNDEKPRWEIEAGTASETIGSDTDTSPKVSETKSPGLREAEKAKKVASLKTKWEVGIVGDGSGEKKQNRNGEVTSPARSKNSDEGGVSVNSTATDGTQRTNNMSPLRPGMKTPQRSPPRYPIRASPTSPCRGMVIGGNADLASPARVNRINLSQSPARYGRRLLDDDNTTIRTEELSENFAFSTPQRIMSSASKRASPSASTPNGIRNPNDESFETHNELNVTMDTLMINNTSLNVSNLRASPTGFALINSKSFGDKSMNSDSLLTADDQTVGTRVTAADPEESSFVVRRNTHTGGRSLPGMSGRENKKVCGAFHDIEAFFDDIAEDFKYLQRDFYRRVDGLCGEEFDDTEEVVHRVRGRNRTSRSRNGSKKERLERIIRSRSSKSSIGATFSEDSVSFVPPPISEDEEYVSFQRVR